MATVLKEKSNAAPVSEEEYLAGELVSEVKHEFVDGQVYAMTGGTDNHARIMRNFLVAASNHLNEKECEAFPSEMKVKTSETRFRYPDVVVVCHETSENHLYKECPVIIVEVLSASSRQKDKTEKKLEYLTIPTLQEYVLIEQDFVDVEVFRKEEDWHSSHYFLGDEVTLASVGLTLSVEEIYARVQNDDMARFLAEKSQKNNQIEEKKGP